MSKIVQLKGKNFLGLPFFDKKVFPITSSEAVYNANGTTVKDSMFGMNKKISLLNSAVSSMEWYVKTISNSGERITDAPTRPTIFIFTNKVSSINIDFANLSVPSTIPLILRFLTKTTCELYITEKIPYVCSIAPEPSNDSFVFNLTEGEYLVILQYGVLRIEKLAIIS